MELKEELPFLIRRELMIFTKIPTDGHSLILHYGDMTDSSSLLQVVEKVKPDEIYNLAAQSHVAVSFEEPEYTANSDALGTLRLLEAIKILNLQKTCRFYQASTSELFGSNANLPQNENTRFIQAVHTESPSLRSLDNYKLQGGL